MRKTISTDALVKLHKTKADYLLIDVVEAVDFAKDHIPGARNVPLSQADFARAVATKASGSRTRAMIVYCAGSPCDAANRAVTKLVQNGFTDVHEYSGGLTEWNEAKRVRLAKAK